MISCNEQNVSIVLGSLENSANCFVCCRDTLGGSLVNTGMADHIWRSEVVHDEVELFLRNTLGHLVTNTSRTHLRVKVICCNLGRGDQLPLLSRELLLDPTVEEEGNVGILLRLRNVALLGILLAEPFCEHVAHVLGWESNGEGVVRLVLGHGCDLDVLGVREVGFRRAVVITQQLGDFTNTIGTVVEEEKSIIVCRVSNDQQGIKDTKNTQADDSPCTLLSLPPIIMGFKNSSVSPFS